MWKSRDELRIGMIRIINRVIAVALTVVIFSFTFFATNESRIFAETKTGLRIDKVGDSSEKVTGETSPNSFIHVISSSGVTLSVVKADEKGAFSAPIKKMAINAQMDVYASDESNLPFAYRRVYVFDLTPPKTPVIKSISLGKLIVKGTSEKNSKVFVYINSKLWTTVSVSKKCTFSVPVPLFIPGARLDLVAVDTAGLSSIPASYINNGGKVSKINNNVKIASLKESTKPAQAAAISNTYKKVESNSSKETDNKVANKAEASTFWFNKYRYVAHALGNIDGFVYTNSREALEKNYAKGYRVFETDFIFTSECELVCRHDWQLNLYQSLMQGFDKNDSVMSVQNFKNSRIIGKYTPLTAREILAYMKSNPDMYLVTDFKSSNSFIYGASVISLLRTADEIGGGVADRIIFQAYNPDNIAFLKSIGRVAETNIIFSYYMSQKFTDSAVMDIMLKNNLSVFGIIDGYYKKQKNLPKALAEKGIKTYVYTINDKNYAKELRDNSVYGIYTDSLFEPESIPAESKGDGIAKK